MATAKTKKRDDVFVISFFTYKMYLFDIIILCQKKKGFDIL